ncbi:MAG TPA: VOC family protein [Dehalococcoidia bacterium]|jgi:glyoxalase family protein|nr:VOC family protein [Dehalococcoidia bacterium]
MPLTLRISHPALTGIHSAETIRFYTEVLGLELVLRQPNLDFPGEEHLFFHAGNDTFIAYFVPVAGADLSSYAPATSGSGHMDHLALDVDAASFAEAQRRLAVAGVAFEGPVDRGYERSVYFKDPNGVTVELLTWITPPPPGMPLVAVIKTAQALREARGAAFIEDEDVRAAITALQASGK